MNMRGNGRGKATEWALNFMLKPRSNRFWKHVLPQWSWKCPGVSPSLSRSVQPCIKKVCLRGFITSWAVVIFTNWVKLSGFSDLVKRVSAGAIIGA